MSTKILLTVEILMKTSMAIPTLNFNEVEERLGIGNEILKTKE